QASGISARVGRAPGLLRAYPDPPRARRSSRWSGALRNRAVVDWESERPTRPCGARRRSRSARRRCARGARAACRPLRGLGTRTDGARATGEGARMSSTTAADPGPSVYQVADRLYLWSLLDPVRPDVVGELNLMRSNQGVSLKYFPYWLEHGFELSEDLPLIDQEFLPSERNAAAGAVDDARPDRWGERVIRFIDKPARLSLLEYLYFAGDDRFGALGVSTSPDRYLPRHLGPLPTLQEADQVHELIRKVQDNEPIPPDLKRLVSPGATMGGARPKALLNVGGEQWVIKFSDGEPADTPLIEHATMTLSRRAQIRSAPTMAVRLTVGHAVAIRRFDRGDGARLHCLSAAVALRAAGEQFGYPELAQLLRRKGVAQGNRYTHDMRELFRRMVFNILIDNTDDHEKNHALVVTERGRYELAPAFDVLPSGRRWDSNRCGWASRPPTPLSPTRCRCRPCSR